MTTSLASQLKKLETPQTQLLDHKRCRSSILFDFSEAAKYGRDVYFDIGKSGFEDLAEINSTFLQFKESLYGKTSKDCQRVVEDKITNTRLDQEIENFLLLLSPYLEKQSALKALEWLIYRFMVNDINKRALLMCIFPYYESALFIRILQIIDVQDETSEWHWLSQAQKSGRPIPKQSVFTRWGHNQSFRGFMAEYIKKMLKVHRSQGNLKIAVSFYVTTVVGGVCLLEDVKEEHLSYIVKMLPKCLSSHHEMVAGMYFIIAQLALKTNLSLDLINNIFCQMIKVNDPPESLRRECVFCMLAITHHQKIEAFNDDAVVALEEKLYVIQQIEEIARTKSVAPFLSAYISGYIRWLLSDSCKLDHSEKSSKFIGLVLRLESTFMSSSDASKVIWSLFEAIKTNYEALVSMKMLKSLVASLKGLEASHPDGHDKAVAHLINLASKSQAGKVYEKLLNELLTNQSGSTSLVHMIHPDADIRLAAVENFVEKVSKGVEEDEMFIKGNMKNMLADEFPGIVLKALTLTKGLRMLEVSYVVKECQKLLVKSHERKNKWTEVKFACLRVLSETLVDRYDEDLQMTVLFICLPFVLFGKNFFDNDAAKTVLKSKMAERISLLSALSLELSPYLSDQKSSKTKPYFKKIWKALPKVLGTLSKEEQTALWNHVKSQLGSEDCLLSHFMSMALLCYGLRNDKTDEVLHLMIAHSLIDACLISFDMFKCSVDRSDQIIEQLSTQDLEMCVKLVMGGSLPVSFLAVCLKEAVRVFKLPDLCTRSRYWTPCMEGPTFEGNIPLLIKGVKGAAQLEGFKEIGNTLRNNVITIILKDCLETSESRYYFLAILWGWHPSLGFSNVIDETLQAWSLSLGSSLLSSQSTSLAWALGTNQPLVPALISALTNHSEMVRCRATECLKRLAGVIGGRLSQDNHSLLLEAVISQADEIIADGSHVSSVLAEFDQKSKSKILQVSQALIEVVVCEGMPMHLIVALLYVLSYVQDTAVLLNLLPVADNILTKIHDIKEDSKLDCTASLSLYYILRRFSPSTSEVLESEDGWRLFNKAITCSKQVLDLPVGCVSPQSILMNQVMSSKFFMSIKDEEIQSQLWSILISRVVESEDPSEAALLRKGLRKVSLDAAVVITQIEQLNLSDKVTSIKAAQAKRIKQKERVNHDQLLAWKKLGLMLETIGVMASLSRPWLLVGPLCQCLQRTLTLDTVITDIVQQQILSALLHLLQMSLNELGDGVSKEVQLNIELIVQCIRSSVSPDTHRRAMLILAFAAKISPDAVLHNMMSIFTFMGTSLLRRDDSYSFQVIHQTIQSIVPTLIKHEAKENLVKLAQVCQVFVDALPDLPEHRRLPLFTQLATTTDASKYLWIIIALLADSHVMRGSVSDTTSSKEEERRGLPHDIQFALTLSSQFSVVAQMHACCQLMEYITSMPEEIGDLASHQKLQGKDTEQGLDIVRWDVYSPRQMCHFKYTSTGLIAHLLSSEVFVGQVYEVTKEQEKELQQLYKQLMEKTMCYLRSVSQLHDQQKDKPGGRLLLSLQRKIVDVIDGINAVIPPNMLIEVTQELMMSPLPLVRCRAMEMLCAKLQPSTSFFSEENIESMKSFVGILLKVALDIQEPSDNRQTALFALQLLTRYIAPKVSGEVIYPVLSDGVDLICREETEVKLVTQALLVVSEAVISLKAHCVLHLSRLMSIIIKVLAENQVSEHLLLAAVTTTQKLVENIPQLLSPYLESLICSLCCIYTNKDRSCTKESRLILRLTAVRDDLIKKIEPRILVPKLTQAFKSLAETEVPALQTFMMIIEMLITAVDEKTLKNHQPAFLTLFTQALDLRTEKGDSEDICKVETTVSCALGKLLLRLNEHDNTAIFLWLRNWAGDSTSDKPSRLITFYRFADHLAGTFKVLFIKAKLADNLFSHSAALLERNNSLNHQKTMFGSGDDAERETCVLLKAILDTLTKIFLYDSVNFINQDRFQLMVKPLIDQLENTIGGNEAYKDRVCNDLIPCITKFTIAVGDDSLWKTLNRQILQRVRNDDQPMVVLASLQTFQALMETLGEDYLQPLLADTMPYITEALESLDTEVEATTREIFTKMEGILGESFRAYLD